MDTFAIVVIGVMNGSIGHIGHLHHLCIILRLRPTKHLYTSHLSLERLPTRRLIQTRGLTGESELSKLNSHHLFS